MKKLTCNELGGACNETLTGETFEEIGKRSKEHVMALKESGDTSHDEAMEKMQNLSPQEQSAMFEEFKKKFEEAPEI